VNRPSQVPPWQAQLRQRALAAADHEAEQVRIAAEQALAAYQQAARAVAASASALASQVLQAPLSPDGWSPARPSPSSPVWVTITLLGVQISSDGQECYLGDATIPNSSREKLTLGGFGRAVRLAAERARAPQYSAYDRGFDRGP
jgi:hypothetical protein